MNRRSWPALLRKPGILPASWEGIARTLRLNPIFDTNIFGHVQSGSIPQRDWRFLLERRPGHGWPISVVTALELLAGIGDVPSKKFHQLREQFDLAWRLSKGRILEEPRFLLCKEVLHVPFPPGLVRPPVKKLSLYMEVVCRARSKEEILEGHVRFPLRKQRAGFDASVVKDVLTDPKKEWVERSERFATEIYPNWRRNIEKTGSRLPPEMRKGIESRLSSETERTKFIKTFLEWLRADTGPQSVAEITRRLDAVLRFTDFVAREFLTRNYNLEKHESDVYDQFQLHYLAMDGFVIVSEDRDFRMRTARSTQAGRIMSFEQFLGTLR